MGRLFVVSGPSGAGKTTITNLISSNRIITTTTRKMRDGEVNGVDYFFVSKNDFENLIKDGKMLEYAPYGDNFYGLTKEEYNKKTSNEDAFIIVTYDGMKKYKKILNDCTSIFIYTPKEDLKRNLIERGSDETTVQSRLKMFEQDTQYMDEYDFIFENTGTVEEIVKKIKNIIYL